MTQTRGQVLEERANARLVLIRRAVIYVPSAILLTGLLVMGLLNLPGSIIAVILLSLGALAVNVEAYQSVTDLMSSAAIRSRGAVVRKWTKARFLFIGRVHYLLVEAELADATGVTDAGDADERPAKNRLFEVQAATALALEAGDELEVVHWPHTNTIVSLTLLQRAIERKLPRQPAPEADASPDMPRR